MSKGLLSDEAAREGDWLEERDEARRRRDAAAAAGAAPDTAGAALGGGGGMVSADMLRCAGPRGCRAAGAVGLRGRWGSLAGC